MYPHTVRWLALILLLSAVDTSTASACSPIVAGPFKPSLERFKFHPGPAQQKPPAKGPYWEPVPEPIVGVVRVTRGTTDVGSSCGDAGVVVLSISLPPSSTYGIRDFGVYFRVLEGVLPDEIFPSAPLVGLIDGSHMTVILAWLDGHPSRQRALNLKVEAFLITNGLDIGQSTVFEIKG